MFPINRDIDDWADPLRKGFELQKAAESEMGAHVDEFNSDGASRALKCGSDLIALPPALSMGPMIYGTTSLIPNGVKKSMEEEFQGTDYWKEYHYVVYEASREGGPIYDNDNADTWLTPHVRDRGHEGWVLKDFVELDRSKEANLTSAETVSLRLYTSPWFSMVNSTLRSGKDITPWATTISVLISALLKLAPQSPPKKLYRALKGVLAEGSGIDTLHIDGGFQSCSDDTEVAIQYSGNPNIPAVVMCIESSFISRAGYIGEIGQCPDENEWTFPPFTAMQILNTVQLGKKTCVHVRPTLSPMRHYINHLRYPWSNPNDPLTWNEYDIIENAVRESSKSSSEFFNETKFSSNLNELLTGAPKTAALGLDAFMGQSMALPDNIDGVAAIEKEIARNGTDSDKKWLNYILYEPASNVQDDWGFRDEGHNGLYLETFYQHPNSRTAGLSRAHVLALRLYTSRFYLSLNNPLRKFKRDGNGDLIHPLSMEAPHQFPISIAFIDDGIRRLRSVEAEENKKNGVGSKEVILWRGMRDTKSSDEFLRSGGVEVSLMSTTNSLEIALQYATKGKANTIFRIVTSTFMDRGANISFLSTYPSEEEYLYPPLTFLSPTGRTQRIGSIKVIELVPRL